MNDIQRVLKLCKEYTDLEEKSLILFNSIKNKLLKEDVQILLEYEEVLTEMQLFSINTALNPSTMSTTH
jgi:hypothetical protein